jgi:UPF0176 protein
MPLYNTVHRNLLKTKLEENSRKRTTISFYKYHRIGNPGLFRDHLYLHLSKLEVLGRIYVANEGINAQLSLPKDNLLSFRSVLEEIEFLKGVQLNGAVEDNGKSFFKLKIKVRPKILADGLNDDTFDVTRVGQHLDARKFNELADSGNTMIIDMRNHYESEIGHFRNSLCLDADTFREALSLARKALEPHRDKHIIMYCTGGIRCEKASAYFRHIGFANVYQLEGGIIKYAHDIREMGLENKFIGKNFVFDDRLGERISGDIISRCHQCGKPCDTHANCRNVACNLLFIQCENCAEQHEGCCSHECQQIIHLSEIEQKRLRKGMDAKIRIFSKGRFPNRLTQVAT